MASLGSFDAESSYYSTSRYAKRPKSDKQAGRPASGQEKTNSFKRDDVVREEPEASVPARFRDIPRSSTEKSPERHSKRDSYSTLDSALGSSIPSDDPLDLPPAQRMSSTSVPEAHAWCGQIQTDRGDSSPFCPSKVDDTKQLDDKKAKKIKRARLDEITDKVLDDIETFAEGQEMIECPATVQQLDEWALAHEAQLEANRIHVSFDSEESVVVIKLPTWLHESISVFLGRCTRSWDSAIAEALMTGPQPDVVGDSDLPRKTLRQIPDAILKPMDNRHECPTVVFESGWSQSRPSLEKKAREYILGSNGKTKVVFIFTFFKGSRTIRSKGWPAMYDKTVEAEDFQRFRTLLTYYRPSDLLNIYLLKDAKVAEDMRNVEEREISTLVMSATVALAKLEESSSMQCEGPITLNMEELESVGLLNAQIRLQMMTEYNLATSMEAKHLTLKEYDVAAKTLTDKEGSMPQIKIKLAHMRLDKLREAQLEVKNRRSDLFAYSRTIIRPDDVRKFVLGQEPDGSQSIPGKALLGRLSVTVDIYRAKDFSPEWPDQVVAPHFSEEIFPCRLDCPYVVPLIDCFGGYEDDLPLRADNSPYPPDFPVVFELGALHPVITNLIPLQKKHIARAKIDSLLNHYDLTREELALGPSAGDKRGSEFEEEEVALQARLNKRYRQL